mmetsp:Transcript_8147/g.13918  ORF Transcript_8147/g.13918 Transcript_8147/m.13918 type:complete len:136 (+) Transcript_8147:314-721(+)
MWIRSATSKTWGMLWLIRMIGIPRARTSLMSSSTLRLSFTPKAAVGSSMIMNLVAKAAARATATPWRCPPDRVSTGCLMDCTVIRPSSVSFSRANLSMACLSSMRRYFPRKPGLRSSRPVNMLSAMDNAGDRARF